MVLPARDHRGSIFRPPDFRHSRQSVGEGPALQQRGRLHRPSSLHRRRRRRVSRTIARRSASPRKRSSCLRWPFPGQRFDAGSAALSRAGSGRRLCIVGKVPKAGVTLSFIRPGRPVENAYIESFNGRFRDECLNEHWFVSMRHAKRLIEEWRIEYNTERPHSSLGYLTPVQFARAHDAKQQLFDPEPELVPVGSGDFRLVDPEPELVPVGSGDFRLG